MKLKPYPEYKDSGIQWVGEIPERWDVGRLKNKTLVKYGFSLSELDRNDGDINVFGSNGIVGKHNKSITKGKTIIIGRKGSHGKVNLSDTSCFPIDTTYFIDNTCTKFNLKYFFYLLGLLRLDESSRDSAVPGLSREFVYNQIIPYSSLPDQTAIANFLDKKTAKIDTLIEKDKKLIALLKEKQTALISHAVTKGLDPNVKFKDSGVEWIGEVPEEVKILPFRRVCFVNQGLQFPEEDRLSEPDEKSKIYITIKYIHAEEEGVKEYIPHPSMNVVCKKEDVLLARTGATGEVVTNQEGVFHNNFFKINYNSQIIRDYLVYYLKMDSVKKILLLKAGVTTIPDLNHDAFLSAPLILYSKEYQQKIVDCLDQATSKIDKTIQKIEDKIKLLEEYKKSLIHHVVTGKVDVRGVVA